MSFTASFPTAIRCWKNINTMSVTLDLESLVSDLTMLQERESVIKELRALAIKDLKISLPNQADMLELVRIYRRYMPTDSDIFTLSDRVTFCKNLIAHVSTPIEQLIFNETSPENIDTVAYVKNQYSDNALLKFREYIGVRNDHAFRSFNEMCDDIENNIYDDCMIPLENTANGKLMNFYSIIDRFDLKIAMTCDIENQSGDQTTRYALLRRTVSIPQSSDNCCFEFSFIAADKFRIKDILELAELVGLDLHRIDSMPLRYNESAFIYYPMLYGTMQNILLFLFFLKLNLIQYNMIGIYDRI